MKLNRTLLIFLLAGALALPALAQSRWYMRHPLPTPNGLLAVSFVNDRFVAVGFNNTLISSMDGIHWEPSRLPESATSLKDVAYGNGRYVAVGSGQFSDIAASIIQISMNGVDWGEQSVIPGIRMSSVTFVHDLFVGFGIDQLEGSLIALTSPDGVVWTQRLRRSLNELGCDANFLGSAVAVGNGSIIGPGGLVSTNGINWAQATQGPCFCCGGKVRFGAGKFVVLNLRGITTISQPSDEDIIAWTSTDGLQWQATETGLHNGNILLSHLQGFSFVNGTFIGVADVQDATGNWRSMMLNSPDGTNWSLSPAVGIEVGGNGELSPIAYGNHTFVTVGNYYRGLGREPGTTILTSSDGINWTNQIHSRPSFLIGAASDSAMIALGDSFVLNSATGIEWGSAALSDDLRIGLSPTPVHSLAIGNGMFVAPLGDGISISTNGLQWIPQPQAGFGWSSRIHYNAGLFLAIGGAFDESSRWHWRLGISPDGKSWATNDVPFNSEFAGVIDAATDGNTFIISAVDSHKGHRDVRELWHSVDGRAWTEVRRDEVPDSPFPDFNLSLSPRLIAFGNERFVALDEEGSLTSEDGFDRPLTVESFGSSQPRIFRFDLRRREVLCR